MLNVKASFLSLLVDIIGEEEITFFIDENSTIRDILKKLRLSIGKNFVENIFDTNDKLNKYIILGLNGKDIRKFNGLDTILEDGDELTFLPAIAGG